MRFPNFFIGMSGVLLAFAIATYLISHSLWTMLVQTAVCAVIIQLGYFVAVLFFVVREKPRTFETKQPASDEVPGGVSTQRPFKSISPTKTRSNIPG